MKISVKDLATELGISEFTVRKLARELYGRANGRWMFTKVQANKIRKLAEEIKKMDEPVEEQPQNIPDPEEQKFIPTAAGPIPTKFE